MVVLDSRTTIAECEQIYSKIYSECEYYLYDKRNKNSKIFQRISNLAGALFNNAIQLNYRRKAQINSDVFTIDMAKDILLQIYKIIQKVDFPINKEEEILRLLKTYTINPMEMMKANPSDEEDWLNNLRILNRYS